MAPNKTKTCPARRKSLEKRRLRGRRRMWGVGVRSFAMRRFSVDLGAQCVCHFMCQVDARSFSNTLHEGDKDKSKAADGVDRGAHSPRCEFRPRFTVLTLSYMDAGDSAQSTSAVVFGVTEFRLTSRGRATFRALLQISGAAFSLILLAFSVWKYPR